MTYASNMLAIQPGTHGGYVVKRVTGATIWEILFAGDLGDCIAYIATHYTEK